MHRIDIAHESRLPISHLFEQLADHNQLSQVFGVPVRRIRDGETTLNGVGSVRKIGPGPLGVEETVTHMIENERIDYRISKGGFPLKNHQGRLSFSESSDGGSRVEWTIEFDSHLPVAGSVIKFILGQAISRGLKRVG